MLNRLNDWQSNFFYEVQLATVESSEFSVIMTLMIDCLFFLDKIKQNKRVAVFVLKRQKKKKVQKKFFTDCHKSRLKSVIHREACVMFLKFYGLINREASAIFLLS